MKNAQKKALSAFFIGLLIFGLVAFYLTRGELIFAEPVEDEQTEETPGEETNPTDPPIEEPEPVDPPAPPVEEENNTTPPPADEPQYNTNTDQPQDGNGQNDGEINAPADAEEASADTKLISMTIACGELMPAFSSDVFEYTVYVKKDQEIKDCRIYVETADPAAEVTVDGPEEFSDSDVTKTITVTGPSGESSAYTVNIHILRDSEFLLGNKLYRMAKEPDLSKLPDGFEQYQTTYKKEDISVAANDDGTLLMVQFANVQNGEDVRWYRLDPEEQKLYKAMLREENGKKSIVISQKKDFVYGETDEGSNYYVYDGKTKDIEFLLMQKGEILKKAPKEESPIIKILLGITAVIAVLALALSAILYRKYKAVQKSVKTESKYFRPYISLSPEEKNEKGNK